MSMFSTLIVDNKEIQFKTGYDDLDVFRMGDQVPFEIIANRPGEVKFADGVYDGTEGFWVVIKDHRIAACLPLIIDETGKSNYLKIVDQFSISEAHPHEWWTDAAWEEKRKRDENWNLVKKARMKAFREDTGADPDSLENILRFDLWCKMREPSFGALLFGQASVNPETGFEENTYG